jgi:1A family penicillin-binding protein
MRKRLWLPLFILIVLASAALGIRAWLFVDLPSLDTLASNLAAPSTKILDRHGRLLYTISDPHAGRHTPIPLAEIPLTCRQATIATEDANFYANPGVDAYAILRAVWINLRGGEVLSGGSTITQQLARNLLLSPQERTQRTLTRKLRESILAWRLARAYSKDQILQLYLNESNYGNLAYGLEAAAQTYFSKHAGELDLSECGLLAGLPQAPALYDPLANPQAVRDRQEVVLNLMVKQGYISAANAQLAKNETLHFAAVPFPIQAPHWVMYVRAWLEDHFAPEEIYRDGLVVTTTLDLDWQNAAQDIVRRRLEELQHPGEGKPPRNVNNAAVLALDPRTGEILTMLGSPDYFNLQISGAVNATLALRQPGSSIKPITYAAAFDPRRADPMTPATMILDVRTSFTTREGEPYVPRNYDLRYHGPVLAREALASSYNLPAVKVLDAVGLDNMIRLARQMGISTFSDSGRYGLALTLGGGEVRLLDMATAYAAFANGGARVEPVAVTQVRDARGQLRYQWVYHPGDRVLHERVAYLIASILSDDKARAPAFGEGSMLKLDRPAAAKTGTTTDWRDNWTLGYTPDLVTGVWVGNANNQPMENVSGITGAGPIWHDFMEAVLLGRPALDFVEPPGLTREQVCAMSGQPPNPDSPCPHTRTEIFIESTQPTQLDTFYCKFRLDAATGRLANANTPSNRIIEQTLLVLPAEALEWARDNGVETANDLLTADRRPQTADGQTLTLDLQITHPDQGTVYQISPVTPRETQRIPVSAQAGNNIQFDSVTLLVDSQAIATFNDQPATVRTLWTLEPGTHIFTARGVDRNGREVVSPPVTITVLP